MTGFYVLTSSTSFNQLNLPVASKTSSAADPRTMHKKSFGGSVTTQSFQKVKLVLTSGSKTDETIVLLADDAVNSFNEHYDAIKLFNAGSSAPDIYSEMNVLDYFMKAVESPGTSQVIVPLKLILKESGVHTINISEFESLEGIKVVLKHGSVETDLNKNVSYSFNSGEGTYTDFELVIGGADSKAPVEEVATSVVFRTWYSKNSLYLNLSGDLQAENGSFIISDYNGRQVYNNSKLNILPEQTTQIPINLEKGFYVTDIMINNIHYKSKFVVY